MIRQENLSANPPEQVLSPIEVDQNAFGLIKQFRDLFESRKPKDRSRKPYRTTWGNDLSIGNVRWRAWYVNLKDSQGLEIHKEVQGNSPQDVMEDHLHLLSRGLQNQQFNPSADITFHGSIRKHPVDVLLRFDDLYRAVPLQEQEYVYVKTPSALQKAREMLAGLQPEK